MLKPFDDLHSDLNTLSPHPEPDLLKKALLSAGNKEFKGIAHLWLSEGIPFAFLSSPAVYQQLRSELARLLDVGIKDISVVGSSRIGYSLADHKFGKEFGDQSDLDLCAVNSELFNRAKRDTEKFIADFESGVTTTKSDDVRTRWSNNCEYLPKNIHKGFIDIKMVPAIKGKYDCISSIKDSIWRVSCRLKNTSDTPNFQSLSIRIYKDWPSMVNQVSRSLNRLVVSLTATDELPKVAAASPPTPSVNQDSGNRIS
ncbi:hypothetical protein [Phytopseudomonas seleniipraecipitans]|uniref:Uncharacterized protein n=1 Tax=Phytopseudomonas seleniipraecipitans TaxID=640205 RepID=A0A1G7JAL5_9GAMM|nr:hypothetical protein [Pseudomonas seleniipraecipitans]SDF21980.1 hypothetical protein SAMN05216381_1048 [Pseudomonas seleniipraecipitans]